MTIRRAEREMYLSNLVFDLQSIIEVVVIRKHCQLSGKSHKDW